MQSLSKKCLYLLIAVIILGLYLPAQLPDLIGESFNYDTETSLKGNGIKGDGWGGAWSYSGPADGGATVYPGTVPLDDVPVPTAGNYIELMTESSAAALYRVLTDTFPDAGQTFWISLLYQRQYGQADANDSYNGFSLYLGTDELLYIGKPWAVSTLGVAAHEASATVASDDWDAYDGAWIVIKSVMNGTADDDSGYVYFNPDPSIEPSAASAELTFLWRGSGGFNRVRVGCDAACCAAFDEIRIAGNYGQLSALPTGLFNSNIGNFPYKFKLEQNYPNPFNPQTTITYTVPMPVHVSLMVCDILGREIATLVNGYQSPGTYQKVFNASQLPSGIYFYRLQAGTYSKTRRMMVLK